MIAIAQYILLAFFVFGTLAKFVQDAREVCQLCQDENASKSDLVTTLLGKILGNVLILGACATAFRSIGFI